MSSCLSLLRKLITLCIILGIAACGNDDPQLYIDEGIALFEKGDLESARVQFQTAIQLNPKAAEAYFRLAEIAEKKGNWGSMHSHLLDAITSNPKHLDAHIKLGQFYLLSGKYDKALEQVKTVLKLEPKNLIGLLMQASVNLRQQKPAEAGQIIERVLEQQPFMVDAVSLKVAYLITEGQDDIALKVLEEGIEHNPGSRELRMLKIRLDSDHDRFEQAIEQYEILLRQNPEEAGLRVAFAEVLLNKEEYLRAEEVLREALAIQPEKTELKLMLVNLVEKRDQTQVEKTLQEFIAAAPNDIRLRFYLAEYYLAGNKIDAAQTALMQILSIADENIDKAKANVKLAQIAMLKNDMQKTESLLDEVLTLDANQTEALLLRAGIRLNRQKIDEAIADLRIVLGNRPNLEQALLLMARANLAKGEREVAESNWHKVLVINPGNLSAVLPLAKSLAQRGDYERAEKRVNQARKHHPVLIGLMELQLQLKIKQQDWSGIEPLIAELAALREGETPAQYWQGRVWVEQGKLEKASQAFQKILNKHPENVETLNTLVKVMRKAARSTQLAMYLQDLINKHPSVDILHYTLAMTYASDKNWSAAEKVLLKKLELTEQDGQAYLLLARIYQSQGNITEAEKIFKLGIQKTNEDPMLMADLAKFYVMGKDYDQAIAMYDQIVERYPGNEEAINNLADLLVTHQSRDQQSIMRARELMARFRDSSVPPIQDTYGWVLVKAGDPHQAVPILKKAVADLAQDARVYYHLGEALYQTGDSTEASTTLKKALELAEKHGDFTEIDRAKELHTQLQQ